MILVGDWVPASNNVNINFLLSQSVVLLNLEGPILPFQHTLKISPKTGPHLFSKILPTENSKFVFSLANNHIMDFGLPGLNETMNSLTDEGFYSCGAGKNVIEARTPFIINDNGKDIGIIACCEAQFGVARWKTAGVAEFGPWVYKAIHELRETVDSVIVTVHAALEDSPWPSPYIRDLFRSFIDEGARVVHGHHAHIPQGFEEYKGGLIFYGMGNFAVDPEKWRSRPNGMWSLGADIDFSTDPLQWRLLTFEIREKLESESIIIEESTHEEKFTHQKYLEICNRPLMDPLLFDALWHEVALRAYYQYGAKFLRFPTQQKQASRKALIKKSLKILKEVLFYGNPSTTIERQHDYLLWYNMFACESHRQMMTTALGILGGEIKDLRTKETNYLADSMM